MAHRDRRANASFDGVPFFVDATTGAPPGTRRVSVRRTAGRDGSINQDTGGDPGEFDVDAFLMGDDYDLDRDALEKALCKVGTGRLVLPTRGELIVRVTRGPITTETRGAQGKCTIRFSVVVESKGKGLSSSTDTGSLLKKRAAALPDIAKDDFVSAFDVAKMPGKYISKAVNAVSSVTTDMRRIQARINGTLNPLQDLSAAINEFGEAAGDLLNTPADFATKLADLCASIVGLADTSQSSVDRTTGLASFPSSAFALSSSVRATKVATLAGLGDGEAGSGATELEDRSAKNVRAVFRLARSCVLARQAQTYAVAPFDSAQLALQVLGAMGDETDALQGYSAGDDLFDALAALRAAAAQHLTQTAGSLPRAVKYKPAQEIPALLVAHNIYGDCRYESDIVARNTVEHPLFVSGEIEVIEP